MAGLLLAALTPATASAASCGRCRFSIPPTTPDQALLALARQSGADILTTEHGTERVATGGVTGTMRVRAALDRLLARTPYHAAAIDDRGFRIVARPRPAPHRATDLASRTVPAPDRPGNEIVVTASKHEVGLLRFPGSVTILEAPAVDARDARAAKPGRRRAREPGAANDRTRRWAR